MSDIHEQIGQAFEEGLERALHLSHRIGEHPELAFEEHVTSEAIASTLENSGHFRISRAVAGLSTAFTAEAGSGELVLGMCAEMDALPEIGHACGHNAIAAATVGAALAVAPLVDELGITLRVFGTPAEERGEGKEIMIKAGVFDGTHAAIMVHPALKDMVTPQIRASRLWQVTYTGREGHASRPWSALNAADATVVAQAAIGLLRQQLRDGIRVHHVVKHAGDAVNVTAGRAVMECMIRADTLEDVDGVWARVSDCFRAGALATGTSVELSEPLLTYSEFRHDLDLAELFQANAEALGRTFPDYDDKMLGSTDMANVSQLVPALHPVLSYDLPPQEGNHTPAFAQASVGAEGDRFIRDAGLAMAHTIADAARSERLRSRLLAGIAPGT